MARLGDLIEQIRGVSYKPEDVYDKLEENCITLLRANNIKDGQLNFDDVVFVDKRRVHENQLLKAGDILICTSSGSKELVGKAAYVKENLPMTFGAFCKVVRPKKIRSDYLGHFFNSPNYRQKISDSSAGANINNIRNEHIDELEVLLPTTDRQEFVAVVLDKLCDLISLRKQQLAKLDELIKARFVEMFGAKSAVECPMKISDYADVLGGYAFKSELFCENAVPVIRISNIKDGCVKLDSKVCFSQDFWENNPQFRAKPYDILMAMSGATIGKAGMYNSSQPALINQRVACIRAKNVTYSLFLFALTQLDWVCDLIQEASAGCAQPNISGKQVGNIPAPASSYEKQSQFAIVYTKISQQRLTIQQSLDKLELLKKSLMQEYFG